jgi:hypothetical protein
MQLIYRGISYQAQVSSLQSISLIQGQYRGAAWITPVYAIAPHYPARLQYRGCQYASASQPAQWDLGGTVGSLA